MEIYMEKNPIIFLNPLYCMRKHQQGNLLMVLPAGTFLIGSFELQNQHEETSIRMPQASWKPCAIVDCVHRFSFCLSGVVPKNSFTLRALLLLSFQGPLRLRSCETFMSQEMLWSMLVFKYVLLLLGSDCCLAIIPTRESHCVEKGQFYSLSLHMVLAVILKSLKNYKQIVIIF